jgi:predicted ArsR family transcriptional regulator
MIFKPSFFTAMAVLATMTLVNAQVGALPDTSTVSLREQKVIIHGDCPFLIDFASEQIPEACISDCAAITQAATSCTVSRHRKTPLSHHVPVVDCTIC